MRKHLSLMWVFLLVLAVVLPQLNADTASQEQRIQQLETLVKDQQTRIDGLQQRLNTSTEDKVAGKFAKKAAADDPKIVAGYDGGFFVRDAEENFKLNITGYMQVGVGIFENNTTANNSFYANGLYLTFDVYIYKHWHGRLQVDFAPNHQQFFGSTSWGNPIVRDGYVEYTGIPMFKVRAGNTHVPFSITGQYGENEGITIWGDPYLSWTHGRDPGLLIYGTLANMIDYSVGIFNGDFSVNNNANDDFLMAGSLRFYPMKTKDGKMDKGFFIHVGGLRSRDGERQSNGAAGVIGGAATFSPWGRYIYGGNTPNDAAGTKGWKTGVDGGFVFKKDMGPDGKNNLRVEFEAIYFKFDRERGTWNGNQRLPALEAYSFYFGTSYFMAMGKTKGMGIFPLFTFSYAWVGNKGSNSNLVNGKTDTQQAYTYTFGLGMAFNEHVSIAFNWIVMKLDERTTYGGPKSTAGDVSGGEEHAWFVQATFQF